MEANHIKTEQNAGEQMVPCDKGNEVISPRDLAAYLRLLQAEEEAGEIPPEEKKLSLEERLPADLNAHLSRCITCSDNWDFLKKTDPVLRAIRRRRVGVIIRNVMAAEAGERERAAAEERERAAEVQEFDESVAVTEPVMSHEEREELVAEMQQAISAPNKEVVEAAQVVADAVRSKPEESGKQVCVIAQQVKEIPDIGVREATTRKVCGLFRDVFDEWLGKQCEEGKLPQKMLRMLMDSSPVEAKSMKSNQPAWLDLSTLDSVPLAVAATAFFSSFPEVISSEDRVFDDRDDTIYFNWPRSQQLLKDRHNRHRKKQSMGIETSSI